MEDAHWESPGILEPPCWSGCPPQTRWTRHSWRCRPGSPWIDRHAEKAAADLHSTLDSSGDPVDDEQLAAPAVGLVHRVRRGIDSNALIGHPQGGSGIVAEVDGLGQRVLRG